MKLDDEHPGTTNWADLGSDALNAAAHNTEGRVQDLLSYKSWRIPREASLLVWQHLIGYLRGPNNVPVPIPIDIDGVAFSATLRVCDLLNVYKDVNIVGEANIETGGPMRVWMGFLLSERIILDRYRRTTA